MNSKRDVLTTGEVAKICHVAPRTVAKWFDRGELRGYRIPGSKDRRIPTSQLVKFMRAHNMPLDTLETGQIRTLILDADRIWSEALCGKLLEDEAYLVRTAPSAFEAGYVVAAFKPHILLVDVRQTDVQPQTLGKLARTLPELQNARLIGVSTDMDEPAGQTLLQVGFHAYLRKPFEIRQLIAKIDATLSAGPW